MDSARGTRTGSRARRKIFSCPVCDEVFVDEESLNRHKLTHENPEASAEPEPPPAEAPPPPAPPAEEESPSAVQEQPQEGRPARPLSAVRRRSQAAQAQAAAPAQVAPENNFLPTEAPSEVMPVDPEATEKVAIAGAAAPLAPLGWEQEARASNPIFGKLWGFIEGFSEWFVRGTQSTAGYVGTSVVSGVGLAFRGLLLLLFAAAMVYAGIWFGNRYRDRLWNENPNQPIVPPPRTIENSPEADKRDVVALMERFYAAIDGQQHEEAYRCLSEGWQAVLPYDKFRSGYGKVTAANCRVDDAHSLRGGKFQIDISVEVTESGSTKRLRGSYVAVRTSSGWRLDEGEIH